MFDQLSGIFGRRRRLKKPFHHLGGKKWIAHGAPAAGDNERDRFHSKLRLFEDDLPLLSGHQNADAIELGGGGRYAHWGSAVIFSTTDGADPNTNRRTYSYDWELSLETWRQDQARRDCARWLRHPQGDRFIELGGAHVPPPLIANLGLTNKCNLRCEICGSQKFLDRTGVKRRHMEFDAFRGVAETLFPIVAQVELNSQGDPLLHPRIAEVLSAIEAHKCEVKIQHNGTLLADEMIDLLLRQHGEIMLSLDAVGDRLDEVRAGAVWRKAEPGLERLLRERDPERLSIGVYPTVTKRSLGDARAIAEWALAHDVDQVVYHRYNPIQDSSEQAPDDAEYARLKDELRRWCVDRRAGVRI